MVIGALKVTKVSLFTIMFGVDAGIMFDLGAPSDVFVVIWVSFHVFLHLWGPWGSIVAPGSIVEPLGYML